MRRLLACIAILAVVGCCAGCASLELAGQEMSDAFANVRDTGNQYVVLVKAGHDTAHPDVTYERAFETYFKNPQWQYFESTKGEDVVEFTGDCMHDGQQVKARVQFIVDLPSQTITPNYLTFNDVPQDTETLGVIIDTAMTGAEALVPVAA